MVCFAIYTVLVTVLGTPLVGRAYFPTANSIAGLSVLPVILLVVGQASGVMIAGP